MTKLIGLTGPAGSGKSFCAYALMGCWHFRLAKFADPLKDMVKVVMRAAGMSTGAIHECIEGMGKDLPCHALMGRTPRHAMQTLGTEWGRDQIDPDFWARLAMIRVRKMLEEGSSVVIDDVRFANEAQLIEDFGGRVIAVNRPASKIVGSHVSENTLPSHLISDTIDNSRDREFTKSDIERILQGINP